MAVSLSDYPAIVDSIDYATMVRFLDASDKERLDEAAALHPGRVIRFQHSDLIASGAVTGWGGCVPNEIMNDEPIVI